MHAAGSYQQQFCLPWKKPTVLWWLHQNINPSLRKKKLNQKKLIKFFLRLSNFMPIKQ